MNRRLFQEPDGTSLEQSDGGGGGITVLEPPPPIDLFPPPSPIEPLLPPPAVPENPYPGAGPPVENPPYPSLEPIGPGPNVSPPPEQQPTTPIEPMPPGAPGSPENPIQATGTAPYPAPPPQTPLPQPPPVVQQTTTTQTGTSFAYAQAIATASINQAINIMNQDVSPLAGAVEAAINASAQTAQQIALDTAGQISQSIGQYSQGFFGWVESLVKFLRDHISDILKTIVNTVEKFGQEVYKLISSAVNYINGVVQNTVVPVLERIGQSIQKVVDFYQQHIQPILQTIAAVEETVSRAIVAIEADIHSGLQGILQLPTDLANAFSSIDQALIRAGRALKVHKADDADFYFVTDDGKGFADHIKSLSGALAGLGAPVGATTFSPGHESLSEPTLAEELPKLLDAMNKIVFDIAKGFKNIAFDPKKLAETLGIGVAAFWAGLFEPLEALLALWEIMKAPLGVIGELAEERVREVTQLSKLGGATLAEAWRRDFITSEAMDEEMKVQGYNKQRSELLRRLTTHVEDTASLLEYRYRGIVTDADFSAGLNDLGFTDSQKSALLEGSVKLFDVATILDAWRRGKVEESTVDQVIKANRFDEVQGELLKVLNFAGPDYQSAYRAYLEHRMLDRLNLPTPVEETIPAEVHDAGHRQGLNDAAILAQWTSQVNSLPSTLWLSLYWRGQASIEELRNALFRDRVPEGLWQNWIDAQRPLIPFRTVPGMVSAGLLNKAQAIAYLEKHGYSSNDAILLMEYATRGSKSSKATTAAAQHDLSLSQAKTAYEDGILTADQYTTLLKAHGLDDNAAALEIKLANITQETKARKQIGIDVVNEYQAGLIDQQTALQQLANSGYTVAEQAAVAKKLRTATAAKAKVPSETEVRAMAKHDVITVDDYYQTLITLGYSTTWASRFRDLYFPADMAGAAPAT